ncbi:DVUA0089 family protein [Roseisolibacter sp. H3M3-2]|uniref:DVUA0089 family protein n=1 Tax=Roseisolibacter sp. H3M3-2 TaxID=3031323 RepID=UPI0023DAA9E3|nr:DVUA0089 family protein [Roseisolibacter sp. H3M3-2]MDF1502880.1 DVUA0089 family protein [Roseisolibacter sp. H3M3-2]
MPLSLVRRAAAAVALVAATAGAAAAQTNLTQTTYLTNAGGPRVATLTFEVLTAGTFRLYTDAPAIDPNLYLFAGTPGALGASLGYNDDGCQYAFCAPAGSYYNSLLDNVGLSAGFYTLVAGSHSLDEMEARTGDANLTANGNVTIRVESVDGTASATSTVPEPSTYALMGTGLLGLAGIARRRRA